MSNFPLRLMVILILLSGCWWFVYLNNGTISTYAHIYYFPIFLSARWWGAKGGGLIGLVAGVLCGQFTPFNVSESIEQPLFQWGTRDLFFMMFGIISGCVFSNLKNKQKEIERQNHEILHQRDKIMKTNNKLKQSSTEIIQALAQAIEIRDPYTSGHCKRVSEMAYLIGQRLGLDEQELLYLKWSGLVHDIGKMGVSEEIINKEEKLTPYEQQEMRKHPLLGVKILSGFSQASQIVNGICHHHERMDGLGYPMGLKGKDIPLQGRIIAVCDVWDALTSKRSYRDAMPYQKALTLMKEGRGSQFDPYILDTFLHLVAENVDDQNKDHHQNINDVTDMQSILRGREGRPRSQDG